MRFYHHCQLLLFYDQESNEVYSNIFFMEKGNIQLNIGPEGRVSGTENNDIYQEITDSIYALHERMSNIYARQAPSDTAEYSPDEKNGTRTRGFGTAIQPVRD